VAVPKQHRSKAKVGKSRMHKYIKPVSLSTCPTCKKFFLPHTVCKNCGYYRGREVINVFAQLTKKERKMKEKELKK